MMVKQYDYICKKETCWSLFFVSKERQHLLLQVPLRYEKNATTGPQCLKFCHLTLGVSNSVKVQSRDYFDFFENNYTGIQIEKRKHERVI